MDEEELWCVVDEGREGLPQPFTRTCLYHPISIYSCMHSSPTPKKDRRGRRGQNPKTGKTVGEEQGVREK